METPDGGTLRGLVQLQAASFDPQNRTGDFSLREAPPCPQPGHVEVAHHWGLQPLRLRNAPRKTLYEQYHPYGTSAYRAQDGSLGVSAKRYRYNGKERDDETKLYYYGARYYAPWLGRWTAADPLAFADGVGAYTYVRGSPIVLSDPNGRESETIEALYRRALAKVEYETTKAIHEAGLRSGPLPPPPDPTESSSSSPSRGTENPLVRKAHSITPTIELQAKQAEWAADRQMAAQDPFHLPTTETGALDPEATARYLRNTTGDAPGAEIGPEPLTDMNKVTGNFAVTGLASLPFIAIEAGSPEGAASVAEFRDKVRPFPYDTPEETAKGDLGEQTLFFIASIGAGPVVVDEVGKIAVALRGTLAPRAASQEGVQLGSILTKPESLWGRTAEEIAQAFNDAGYTATVRQSTRGSGNARVVDILGHSEVGQIRVHPGGGRHRGAYIQISTSTEGRVKVVDPTTYKAEPGEKARIVPFSGGSGR